MIPGEILYGEGDVVINEGAERIEMAIVNTGDRPVQVGSHVHLPQANAALNSTGQRPTATVWTFRPGRRCGSNPASPRPCRSCPSAAVARCTACP